MTVERVTLADDTGVEVELVDIGAAIDIVRAPDRAGTPRVITLPLADDLRSSVEHNPSVGATVGPFANRLVVDEEIVLHGGPEGWSWRRWNILAADETRAVFAHEWARAIYDLRAGRLDITLEATPPHDTVLSMTNHAYWNLGGPLDDHDLTVHTGEAVPVDEVLLPTGPPSPLDAPIGLPGDHDTCFMIDGDSFRQHAVVTHAASGRRLEVWSDHPTLQVYTGYWVDDVQGLALEPYVPNAPALAWAPSAAVAAGETYRHHLAFHISVDGEQP